MECEIDVWDVKYTWGRRQIHAEFDSKKWKRKETWEDSTKMNHKEIVWIVLSWLKTVIAFTFFKWQGISVLG